MSDAQQRIGARTEGLSFAEPQYEFSTVRVLAVDDEPPALRLLCLILSAHPVKCTVASNGEEALVALQRQQFDAVISDLCMPGIGGMELLA